MSVPTHGPSCATWVYPTSCWHCGSSIHVLQCTCGSVVLLDAIGDGWPKHDCASSSLPKGWAAIDVLRSLGIPIDKKITEKIFGKNHPKPQAGHSSPEIVKVDPTNNAIENLLCVIRETPKSTKKLQQILDVSELGLKILKLAPSKKYSQITVHTTNHEKPESYTCLISDDYSISSKDIGHLAFLSVRGVNSGGIDFWIVEDFNLV